MRGVRKPVSRTAAEDSSSSEGEGEQRPQCNPVRFSAVRLAGKLRTRQQQGVSWPAFCQVAEAGVEHVEGLPGGTEAFCHRVGEVGQGGGHRISLYF